MIDAKLLKSVAKGLLTFVPGVTRILDKKKGKSAHSGSHADFCYNLWLSILRKCEESGVKPDISKTGEIGTGGSLGGGICALLAGADKYYALEMDQRFNKEQNLKMLEELVLLFRGEEPISQKYPQLNIKTAIFDFPHNLVKPNYLDDQFIQQIREDIESEFKSNNRILIVNKWDQVNSLCLDFIFSRAVLEHVVDPGAAYLACYKHLKASGYMIHDVEFHSHGITSKPDGHMKIHSFLWKIIYGRRNYFLNRWTLSEHINQIQSLAFHIVMNEGNYSSYLQPENRVLVGAVILAEKGFE